MKISIDLELAKSLADIAAAANESLVNGVNTLNRVTSHNDWTCKERTAINQQLEKCKQLSNEIYNCSQQYFAYIRQMTGEYDILFNSIPSKLRRSEQIIAKLMSVGTLVPIVAPSVSVGDKLKMSTASIVDSVLAKKTTGLSGENYIAGGLNDTIRVCHFSDFNYGD